MRKEDACGSDCGCESPLKTGQHRNINNAQYTKGAKNPEKLHATASVESFPLQRLFLASLRW